MFFSPWKAFCTHKNEKSWYICPFKCKRVSTLRVIWIVYHHLEMKHVRLEHDSHLKVINTLLLWKASCTHKKSWYICPFQCKPLSMLRVIKAIYHKMEVKHISLEHKSHFKVWNTLLVKEWFSRSEKHFAHIKMKKWNSLNIRPFQCNRVTKLAKGYISHLPPFGSETHLFWAQFTC